METAIRTENLSRHFGSVRAVDGLDLVVPARTLFGFLGPNGAGKTTTIHLLLGLFKPTGGRAEVFGLDPIHHGDRVRARVGALLEHPGLYERLSAEENLEFYARVYGLPLGERRERIRTTLEQLGLWDRRKDPVGKWSRGMKQKLAIARAILHRPPLVFLDEPTAGHDPGSAAELRDHLVRLVKEEGTTVFLTTHNLAEAEKICDRVGVIRAGRLVTVGPPSELRRRAGAPAVEIHGTGFTAPLVQALKRSRGVEDVAAENGRLRLELAADAQVPALVKLIVQKGGQIEEVRRQNASLEDAFLQLLEKGDP